LLILAEVLSIVTNKSSLRQGGCGFIFALKGEVFSEVLINMRPAG
jgi:hypothetical protein